MTPLFIIKTKLVDSSSNKGKSVVVESHVSVVEETSRLVDSRSDFDDVIILGESAALAAVEAVKKQKRSYELRRHYQEIWVAKLPWAEAIVGEDGSLTQVKCTMCSKVEGRDKLLVAKIDNLWKHARRKKAEKEMFLGRRKVKKGEYYFISDNAHVKNEHTYFAFGKDSILQQVIASISIEKKKLVQFTLLFHLLSHDRPMIDYKESQKLFAQLKVPNTPKKHWGDNLGWEMVESMNEVILAKTK